MIPESRKSQGPRISKVHRAPLLFVYRIIRPRKTMRAWNPGPPGTHNTKGASSTFALRLYDLGIPEPPRPRISKVHRAPLLFVYRIYDPVKTIRAWNPGTSGTHNIKGASSTFALHSGIPGSYESQGPTTSKVHQAPLLFAFI